MQTPTFNTKFKKKKKIKKITLLLRQKSVWGGFTLSHEHQQLATSTITTTIPGNGEMKRSDNSPSSTSEAGDKLFLQTLFSCQEFILVFNSICVLPSILAIKEQYVSRTVSRWLLLYNILLHFQLTNGGFITCWSGSASRDESSLLAPFLAGGHNWFQLGLQKFLHC